MGDTGIFTGQTVAARSGWTLVVLLAAALAALAFFTAPNIIGLFHDDGIYAVVAKALSEGQGYRIISVPGEPYQSKYPFLYSYLLSWVWTIAPEFPANVALIKLSTAFFYFIALLFAYALYRRNAAGGRADAALYVFAVGANTSVYAMTTNPLSDVPFMASCLFCLALSEPGSDSLSRTRSVVLLACGAAVAFLLRQAGAALIVAGLFYFLFSKERKGLYVYSSIVLFMLLPWVVWQALHSTAAVNPLLMYYQSYERPAFVLAASDPGIAIDILRSNVRYLASSIDQSVLRLSFIPSLRFLVYPLMLWGLWSIARRQNIFFNGFLLAYMLLILSWPWPPGRYLMPIVPILLLALFKGTQLATAVIRSHATKAWSAVATPVVVRIPVAIVVLLIGGWLWNYAQIDRTCCLPRWNGYSTTYGWSGFAETFSWIKQNTREDAVLATAYDPMYYLYTGRKAVRPWIHRPETYFYPHDNASPDIGSADEIHNGLNKLGVRYLIVNPLEGYVEKEAAGELFANLLRVYSPEPQLVFESSDGLHKIYALPSSPAS